MFTVMDIIPNLKHQYMPNDLQQDHENKSSEPQTPHQSLAGKKVDADPDEEKDQPADENNLVTEESQKGKTVDGDPEEESDQPTPVE